MINTYSQNFWNTMRGKAINPLSSNDPMSSLGAYPAPDEFKGKFDKALAKDNVFRRLVTVVHTTAPEGTIQAVASTGMAEWIAEGVSIPESADAITPFSVYSYKLASLVRLNNSFVGDNAFDIEKYLLDAFARRFGRAEDAAFLSGTGVDEPTGLLSNNGADVGVTAANITYDDVVKLYFSLKSEYRTNAVFLMHDDTAMALRTLKDSTGNPIWNA
jgi:HK97 family phage major capsid protein